MPLFVGSVSVANTPPTFPVSGTGLAREFFDALRASPITDAASASSFHFLDFLARLSNVLAPVIVAHITTHAVVSSTVNPLGLVSPSGAVTGTANATGTIT